MRLCVRDRHLTFAEKKSEPTDSDSRPTDARYRNAFTVKLQHNRCCVAAAAAAAGAVANGARCHGQTGGSYYDSGC